MHTEQQLEGPQSTFSELQSALNDHAIMAVTDPRGRITYANDNFCAISQYSRQELLGQDHRIINSGYHSKEFMRGFWATITHGRVWHGDIKNKAKDGSFYWVDTTVVPLLDDQGNPREYVAIRNDITERRNAQEALRSTNAQLSQLLEHSPVVLYVLRLDGEKIVPNMVSENVHTLLGFTVAEALSYEWWYGHLHPDDRERALESLTETLTSGSSRIEYRLRHKDGSYCWLDNAQRLVLDDAGAPLEIIGVWTDIDERKKSEEALSRQQAEMRVLFDLIPAMIWFKDAENGILRVNQRVADAAGKRVDEIEGRPSIEVYPQHAAKYHADDLEVIHSRVPKLGIVETLIGPEGKELWIQTDKVPVCDREGKAIGIVVMAQDVTERKRVEDALRTSEMRFKAMFEQAGVGVAQAELESGRFVQVNQRFCENVGYSREELMHLSFLAITHPQDVAASADMVRRMKAGEIREITLEKRYIRKDGSEVWATLTASAMWAPGETPDYIIGILQDITQRKHLEEQYRQAQKMEAIGTLAGGIAHDFNNILAAIVGYTELARMTLKENPKARGHLESVLQAASRATDLVRQILTFSRQQKLERKPIELRTVVLETINLLRAALPSTIEFDTSLATDAPTVFADATQVHQVLMNLGTNAWHAMRDQTGRLEVRLERCSVDAALAALQPRLRPGEYARISVSDTGCGMEPETMRRIFEPFFTTKAPGDGTGLGLAVVHGIMDGHDGAVIVTSHPGEGTRFDLYFPAHAAEVFVEEEEEGQVPRGQGERILFVDDEELLARLGQLTLKALGYEVEIATQPERALAMVRADPERFALVITDQTMPGMTGLSLAGQLLAIRPGLPIIMTTGYSASLTPERAQEAGIRQVLLKPTSVRSLGTSVHEAIADRLPG
jgi:PAS domain S-box-containing protein